MSGDNALPKDKNDDIDPNMKAHFERIRKSIEESNKQFEERLKRHQAQFEDSAPALSDIAEPLSSRVRVLLAFAALIFSMLSIVNIISPGAIEKVFQDSLNIIPIVLAFIFTILVVLIPRWKRPLEDTFLDIDRNFNIRVEKPEAPSIVKNNVTNIALNRDEMDQDAVLEEFPQQSFGASSDFEYSISEIVEYLGNHIKLAESKASKLLDKGTTYLRRGLYFYIGSIILWQIWGHFVSFDGLVIAGMISTSLAFVIIEFLAAWFLKQYRSFVDSSMAYMRVQSFFNRYLLLYYAARDFGEAEGQANLAKGELLKVLSQEIKWPDLKDINANDFNYMVEAMGTMHTSFEKLKGIVQPKGETKS